MQSSACISGCPSWAVLAVTFGAPPSWPLPSPSWHLHASRALLARVLPLSFCPPDVYKPPAPLYPRCHPILALASFPPPLLSPIVPALNLPKVPPLNSFIHQYLLCVGNRGHSCDHDNQKLQLGGSWHSNGRNGQKQDKEEKYVPQPSVACRLGRKIKKGRLVSVGSVPLSALPPTHTQGPDPYFHFSVYLGGILGHCEKEKQSKLEALSSCHSTAPSLNFPLCRWVSQFTPLSLFQGLTELPPVGTWCTGDRLISVVLITNDWFGSRSSSEQQLQEFPFPSPHNLCN